MTDNPKSTLPDSPWDVCSIEETEGWMRKILNEEIPDLPEATIARIVERMNEVAGGWGNFCAAVTAGSGY